MVSGAAAELQKWEQTVFDEGGVAEIDVVADLHKVSGRIISRTAFGDDFEKGEQIFKFQTLLAEELLKSFRSAAYWLIPGSRYFYHPSHNLMKYKFQAVFQVALT